MNNICIGVITVLTFVVKLRVAQAVSFPFVYPRIDLVANKNSDAGDPLILTPYLERQEGELARNLSRVYLTEKIVFQSYAGFFTINKKYESNMYFWFFPAFNKNIAAPVILWLQGGPGASSLYGLFTENGPLIAKKGGFATRKYHWALKYNIIFIDNPVGTGFSFTKDAQGYCKDEICIAEGLYECMQQFFELFPMLKYNDFYITGESYAGKYIPSLGVFIHKQNLIAKNKINLKGMALGNAYCDPINQIDYGNYLYQLGLLDRNQRIFFSQQQLKIIDEIQKKNWVQAGIMMDKLMDGDLSNFSYFRDFTGFNTYYNFLFDKDNTDMSILIDLLNNDKVRSSVHVGRLPFNSGKDVQINLAEDILQSVAPYISTLLNFYRMLFYNGQLDIIVAYPLTENFLRNLNFSSNYEYKLALRKIWRVEGEIAGYYKKAGNLTEVLVRNAGHMVPHDQPKWAMDLMTMFIENKL
ncbi:unnamed protein product [Leptidea sinapis]|uniref:Carboxypeptidase n=1 Tax=Leptidea sinapis TaxID=189913 RepID=A0A5E4Q3D0_9NEOP|nr:unnamed protein product [Leptidea sinapis]